MGAKPTSNSATRAALDFYILDVFAERRYAGNQLAVFVVDDVNVDIPMQQIAREINFSETTFVRTTPAQNGGFDVRIFTPGAEVPFAGHPSLGTARVIHHVTSPSGGLEPETVVLNEKVGPIPVRAVLENDGRIAYWMKHNEPEFGSELPRETVARVLGLPVSAIDPRYPVQQVSTGLPFIIAPLTGLSAMKSIRVSEPLYWDLIGDAWAKNLMVYCPESHEPSNDLSVRMFSYFLGIPEDPATGSGNGCLAAYLARHRCLGGPILEARAEQGYEIGRPSLLYLHANDRGNSIDVSVGGHAVVVASGRWAL